MPPGSSCCIMCADHKYTFTSACTAQKMNVLTATQSAVIEASIDQMAGQWRTHMGFGMISSLSIDNEMQSGPSEPTHILPLPAVDCMKGERSDGALCTPEVKCSCCSRESTFCSWPLLLPGILIHVCKHSSGTVCSFLLAGPSCCLPAPTGRRVVPGQPKIKQALLT